MYVPERNHSKKNLPDTDSDDENILCENYILLGDDQSLDTTPERTSYPDANSHSNYNLLTEDAKSSDSWSRDVQEIYSAANSHRNTFQDSNSHSKYDIYSDNSEKNCETSYDDRSSYSVANSHGTYRILSENSDRTGENENLSRENLIPPEDSNYEIANSHSNYQIFYNSQTQYEIKATGGRENFSRKSLMGVDGDNHFQSLIKAQMKCSDSTCSPARSESSRSSRSTEETSTTCDIEECLIQIEESLLNIEQNLLHVQDLDIPELKNLLYKSPSIERSLFEVQDLLCTENIESVKRGKLFSLTSVDDAENLMDMTSKDDSANSDLDTFTNDDNLLQFTDDRSTSDIVENSASVSSVLNSLCYTSADKNVNFIPNSLGKTPFRSGFERTKENIRAYSLDNRDFANDRGNVGGTNSINYNLNSEICEKKLLGHKRCHSRTSSLDENSIFQNTDFGCQRKTSLENLFRENDENRIEGNAKAKSEDTLERYDGKTSCEDKPKSSRRARKRTKGDRIAEVEAKAEEFRKKIENIISNRQSVVPHLDNPKKPLRNTSEPSGARSTSQEKSPRFQKVSLAKSNDQDSPPNKQFKSNSFEKRKRKKPNRTQSSENALVPSKLISLSLSLLLAALLQAVRCLTDLVEDAFRSVSFERNGLLE